MKVTIWADRWWVNMAGDSSTTRIREVEKVVWLGQILQVLRKSTRKASSHLHVFTLCLIQIIPWQVWQGPMSHTHPIDQVSQMENSPQSIGGRTQNPQPEELNVNLFIARGEGIFPRVASGWTSPVTHIHLNKSNALHRHDAARLCYILSPVWVTLHFPISC